MQEIPRVGLDLPTRDTGPLRHLGKRFLIALGLIVFVALLTYLGRDGYVDPEDDSVSLLDSFYYSTVSITTTGYGDVRPVSDSARLVTTLLVTPARILFLIVLVGTTVEILTERSRQAFKRALWKRTLHQHTIICGYGAKGRSAANTLLAKGLTPAQIVVIDERPEARARATAAGMAAVAGSSATTAALLEAGIADAKSIVVAVDRDDTAVLTTLTARELNPTATIVAAVREAENHHLLHQGGANSVITTAEAAGRLLGHAVDDPRVAEVLEDLMSVGEGLDIIQRPIAEQDVGPLANIKADGPVIGLIRKGEVLRFDNPAVAQVQEGDVVVFLHSHRE